ncbi:hypothetical protein GCM10009785_08340 [Brooklawnia cerclae]|uniref:Uncharacterized protein n=1 Tax=Brooklawnia cerclae TaxID=349934 RepID=A0ABX0SK90_9ACTN|nr:hypothetical protein [Brooklawnia cerclae]NIH58411.1 hypothetical protein [Brooklawnia cerclae]
MSNEKKELSATELQALVAGLEARIEKLEAEVEGLRASRPVPEEDLIAIAAAAAAYMGYKGTIKAVTFASKGTWAAAGRRALASNQVRGVMPRSM